MTAFISPKATGTVEFEGVTFTVRGLTAEERMPILFGGAQNGTDKVSFGPDAFKHAIRLGLLGWDAEDPAWSTDMEANIELLSDGAYLAIGTKIMDLSFIGSEEKQNL